MTQKTINYIAVIAMTAVAAVLSTIFIVACNQYERVPENSSFIISCSVADGTYENGADMNVSIVEGTIKGDCLISLFVKDALTGKEVVGYRLRSRGGSVIDSDDIWSFDRDGSADFVLTGLQAGSYVMKVTVERWYHTATAVTSFKIND